MRVCGIRARCSILKSQEREGVMDLELMKTLLEVQMGVINSQTEVIQNLEATVRELRVLVLETRCYGWGP